MNQITNSPSRKTQITPQYRLLIFYIFKLIERHSLRKKEIIKIDFYYVMLKSINKKKIYFINKCIFYSRKKITQPKNLIQILSFDNYHMIFILNKNFLKKYIF